MEFTTTERATLLTARLARRGRAIDSERLVAYAAAPAQESATDRETQMHAVVRHYKGSPEIADELVRRSGEVEELIRGVDGFVAYFLVKTADGAASISVFEDQAGTEESTRRAAAYVKENLATIAAGPPEVIEGETVIHFAR